MTMEMNMKLPDFLLVVILGPFAAVFGWYLADVVIRFIRSKRR